MISRRKKLTLQNFIDGLDSQDIAILGKAITLIESSLSEDNQLANKLLLKLKPNTKNSIRIGITGTPGAGKSTFIDSFGSMLCNQGLKIAVLAIDPSSVINGGSILGDKTRMEKLANNKNAFIRPSPSRKTLGGVASKTREAITLCEAAGFDVIIVETVGVGQSEIEVKYMVDFFLLIILSKSGSELQGIKRGIVEMADCIAVNKADGDNIEACNQTKIMYQNALKLFPNTDSGWKPKVTTCSAMKMTGLREIWRIIERFITLMKKNSQFEMKRDRQRIDWMHHTIKQILVQKFYKDENIEKKIKKLEKKIYKKEITEQQAISFLFFNIKKKRKLFNL